MIAMKAYLYLFIQTCEINPHYELCPGKGNHKWSVVYLHCIGSGMFYVTISFGLKLRKQGPLVD